MSEADQTYLYITTIGHKTGRQHQIEIWYVDYAGNYYIVSEKRENAHWVRNLTANPNITFSIGTREDKEGVVMATAAIARSITKKDEPSIVAEVIARMENKYNWSNGLIVQIMPSISD